MSTSKHQPLTRDRTLRHRGRAAPGLGRLRRLVLAASVVVAATSAGASPGDLSTRKTALDLRLDPDSGELEGRARLLLYRRGTTGDTGDGQLVIELLETLQIDSVEGPDGSLSIAPVTASESAAAETSQDDSALANDGDDDQDEESLPTRLYRISLPEAEAGHDLEIEIEIGYRGKLQQDWAAGEEAGEIHNFEVQAHVGRDGVYLSGGMPWYPRRPLLAGAGAGSSELIDFETRLGGVPGMVLVASGSHVVGERPRQPGMASSWRTPFPLPALAVAGGPHRVFHRRAGGVDLYAHLGDSTAAMAPRLLEALVSYLELYQPLLGAHPYRELTLVENFFSSGFAFPGFMLVASQVLQMGEGALRPGYLDHELLHSWWGNGVLGAPGAGRWSEALASYGANLMRDVLEGSPEKAAAQRRSIAERLSQLAPADHKPLCTFGQEDGASRFIGYQKGSLVFDQLAREVGQEAFWYALRNLAQTRMGEPTTWDDLEAALLRATGKDLRPALDYWVRGSELPELSPRSATWSPRGELRLALRAPLGVPVTGFTLRLVPAGEGGTERQAEVDLAAGTDEIVVTAPEPVSAVEIDPDFETLRRIPPELWMPTISGISAGRSLLILRSDEEGVESDPLYAVLAERLGERYEDKETAARESRNLTATIAPGHVLALGSAIAAGEVSSHLSAIGLDVDLSGPSFSLTGSVYAEPGDSFLACTRRQGEPGAVLCAYWGNSASALERSYLVPFYGGDSLLIFGDGRPHTRRRFQAVERIPVTHIP